MNYVQLFRIVVASPDEVQVERDLVDEVARELNRTVAPERNLRLEVTRWETHVYPGFHSEGPQGLIDYILSIKECDLFIGIFWKHFGTPTGTAGSGTEHEFRQAYEAWQQFKKPQISFYFSQKPFKPESLQQAEQWTQVLNFQKAFPREGLWWEYGEGEFERLLHRHLTQIILQQPHTPSDVQSVLHRESTLEPIFDFKDELNRHPELIGRQWLKRQVQAYLDNPEARYLLLEGPPGTGKSALVSELVREGGDKVCYHFIVRGMGEWSIPTAILKSLTAQLRQHFQIPLAEKEDRISASFTFNSVLIQASRQLDAEDKIIIYLDGLDETFGSSGPYQSEALRDTLPPRLPPQVCFVLTSRSGDHLHWLADPLICKRLYLDPQADENLDDIRLFTECENKSRALQLSDRLLTQLVEASEGIFGAAVLLLRELRENNLENWKANPELIPQGIQGWLESLWDRLTARFDPLFKTHLRAILGLVAASRNPMSRTSLQKCLRWASEAELAIGTIKAKDIRKSLDDGLEITQEFFDSISSSSSSDHRYRFFHTSFREFITDIVGDDLKDCHLVLAEYYQKHSDEPKDQIEAFYQYVKAGKIEQGVINLVLNEKYIFDLGYTYFLDECLQLLPETFRVSHNENLFLKASEYLIRGKVCYYSGNFDRAFQYYQYTFTAIEEGLAPSTNELHALSRQKLMELHLAALEYRGLTYRRRENFAEAISDFETCRDLAQKLGEQVWEAHALSDLGLIYRETGQYDKAISHLKRGAKKRDKILDRSRIGDIPNVYYWTLPLANIQLGDQYSLLSYCYWELGQHKQARKMVKKAHNYFEAAGAYGQEAYYRGRLLCASAFAEASQGEWDQAINYASDAYEFPKRQRNKLGEIAGQYCLGVMYLMQAERTEDKQACDNALHHLNTCLTDLEAYYRGATPIKFAKTHLALCKVYHLLGDAQRVTSHSVQADHFSEQAGKRASDINPLTSLV